MDASEASCTDRAGKGCRNVCELLGVGEVDGRYLILALEKPETPYLDLTRFILECRGGMYERTAKYIFSQLAMAVQHCHKVGVAHGDINPGNVLIEGRTGRAMLIDFGKAVADFHQDFYRGRQGKL